jgi:hypothetical protein
MLGTVCYCVRQQERHFLRYLSNAGSSLDGILLVALSFDRTMSQLEAPKLNGIDSWYRFDYLTHDNGQLCQLRVRLASIIDEGLLVEFKEPVKAKHPYGIGAVQSTITGVKFLSVQDVEELHPEFGERLHRSGLGHRAQSKPACSVHPPASATSQASGIRKVLVS